MDKKRVIFIGRSTAGKTTLCQRINNEDLIYHKTQTLDVVNHCIIDTPGEYLERTSFRGALTVAATDADIIIFMQDATEDGTCFPPMYGSLFCKPIVGVVTKADIATKDQIEHAKLYLRQAGAKKIFVTSAFTGEGVSEFVREIGHLKECC